MKLRLWWRRWSVAAPRMTVRSARPWWWQAALGALAIGLAAVLAAWAYERGATLAGFDYRSAHADVERLEAAVHDLRAERDNLASAVNASASDIAIERAAQEQLIGQVKALEDENARLKQDLAFFERILPSRAGEGVAIRSFQVEREEQGGNGPRRLRYRILVSQEAKATRDFVGQVQFVLVGVQEGKPASLTIPERADGRDPSFMLSFRMFQRLEGVLELPVGVKARSVQLRVLENGAVRTQQTAAIG